MARFDKVRTVFRAPLLSAITSASLGGVFGVSLDANGKVVIGTAGQSGFVGVICPDKTFAAGDIIDVMKRGEIVEFTTGANGAAFAPAAAGTKYYVNSGTGALETAAPAAGTNKPTAGHTVEAKRLVVDCSIFQG